jgi:hypothetical protein
MTIPPGRITCQKVKRCLGADATVIIGIDTEYETATNEDVELPDQRPGNHVLCYTFTVADPTNFENRVSGIIFTQGPTRRHRLGFNGFLAWAIHCAIEAGLLTDPPERVLACCHFSRADLPGFRDFKSLKRKVDAVRRTYATTTRPAVRTLYTLTGRPYSLKVVLLDTMLLAPNGHQSLKALGELLGFPKIEIPAGAIEQMSKLMHDDPALFEAYAVRDAEVSAAWLIAVLRFFEVELGIDPGRQPPATLGAAAVKKFKALCQDDGYALDDLLGFERVATIVNGRRRSVRQKMAAYRDREGLFADCYHGGRNEAYYAGFTPDGVITDIDICGAYTTAMAAIRTPDWCGAVDTTEIDTLAEVGGRGMAFARVCFRFPAGARFPCLAVRAGDAGLVFPLSGTSYATGPELVVARRLGATIEVERGVFVPWLDERRPFLRFTKVINTIRKAHSKGTPFELTAKETGNSLYGKVAQGIDLLKSPEGAGKAGIRGKRVFDSRMGEMTTLPPSSISCAALAAFTTGLVRAYLAELLAAVPPKMAVYTATTDGLLTEASLTDLQDTGPLASIFAKLRELVAGDPATLEVKGRIAQALVVKTRGTFTAKPLDDKLHSSPIMARAGFRLEDRIVVEPRDGSPEARADARRAEAWAENDRWLEVYRTRDFELIHHHTARIDLRTQWLNDTDLVDVERSTRVNLDADLKRRPVGLCEREGVLAFDTKPWDTLEDFIEARDALEQWKRSEKRVLRTLHDWHAYRAWAEARPAKRAANTRGGRPPFITAIVRARIHSQLGLTGPAGRGKTGGERIADLARDMTAAGFPITRTSIDNTRRQEPRLAAFSSLTDTERVFLRWALDRWPDADLLPLAIAGTAAAAVIALVQEKASERRAAAMSRGAPAASNTSQAIPPYSRKDALRAVPHGGAAPSDNSLNDNNHFNASYRQLNPTAVPPVRAIGIVRSRANGAAPLHAPDQEQFAAEEGHRGPAGKSPVRPFTPIAED